MANIDRGAFRLGIHVARSRAATQGAIKNWTYPRFSLDRKTLQLARVGEENTTITVWDIERAVQARYRADIESLQRYFASAEGDPRNIVQKLRPVVEGHCRNVSAFPDEDSLGEMIGKIRAAGPAHPLAAIHDQLEELNEYARRYHHAPDSNEAVAQEPPRAAELEGYVRQTLRLVGCLW